MGYSVRLCRDSVRPASLSMLEIDRLTRRVERMTPSEPWAQWCRAEVYEGRVPFKAKIAGEFHRRKLFPPGGSETRMVHCRKCGPARWHPPQSVQNGLCDHCREVMRLGRRRETDHSTHHSSTSSPIAEARAELEVRGYQIVEPKLDPESTEALKAQIARYQAAVAPRPVQVTPTAIPA